MTQAPETPTKSGNAARMPRWLKALFALSLAGNLAVVGLVAGAALRGEGPDRRHPKAPPPPAASEAIGGVMFRYFDTDQRRALKALADGPYDNIVERRVAELQDLLALIRAEPLDLAALKAEIATQSQTIAEFRVAVQEAWLSRLAAMDAGERAELADKVEKHIARFRKPPKQ